MLPASVRFGTDGVRGVANAELTPELVLSLGRAAARVLGDRRFLVARDTRRSGSLLEAALTAGLAAEGAEVARVGVFPTPGVAWLAAADGVPAAMISASHNPAADNGVKLFAAGGRKLTREQEVRIEAELAAPRRPAGDGRPAATGPDVGTVTGGAGVQRYLDALVASLDGRRLDGLSVVVDCAHGAAWRVAPDVLRRLGASVDVLHADPDGMNINQSCGSGHPEALSRRVVGTDADAGLAFDGDADRVVTIDHRGLLHDGDHVMAVCALDLASRDRLRGRTVVVTVMTNLGFRLAMAEHGIDVKVTDVGDRHVLEALEAGGWSLGGEQSGHVIFADLATTGDGILTAVQVLDVVRRSGRRLADLAAEAMTTLPQVLRNVTVADRQREDTTGELAREVAAVEAELGERGRVLVRRSGTEPVLRVMVEAATLAQAEAAAARLSATASRVLGGS